MRHFACLLAIWPHTLILSPNKKFQSGRKLASFLKKNTAASSEPLPSARAVATRWLPASSVEIPTSLYACSPSRLFLQRRRIVADRGTMATGAATRERAQELCRHCVVAV